MSDKLPEYLSEYMLDRLLCQKICQRECQLVGVTRTEYLLICSIFSSFCDDDDDDDDGDDNNNDIYNDDQYHCGCDDRYFRGGTFIYGQD